MIKELLLFITILVAPFLLYFFARVMTRGVLKEFEKFLIDKKRKYEEKKKN
jgi:hypothetical protein